jgi:asparagine synthase (glutamine-hydrolysing)
MAGEIAGWVCSPPTGVGASEQLERMLSAARPGNARALEDACVTAAHGSALGATGLETSRLFAAPDGPWAVIDGSPVWHDGRLASIARDRGPAAAVLHGYARLDERVVATIGGRFRLAIIEPRRNRALLAVDRVASMPLCYARTAAGALAFASSLDALRAHDGVSAELSSQALLDYFHFQVVYGPATIYAGVQRLVPAQLLIIEDGRTVAGRYWNVPYATARYMSSARRRMLAEDLHDTIRRAVATAARGEGRESLGTFLSGGLDSSSMLGMATREIGVPVPSFTARFDVAGYDEGEYAAIVSRHFGSPQHLSTITPDHAVEALPLIARVFDQPFGNPSAIGVLHCARAAAAAGVGALLAGDGGDEVFAGHDVYLLMQKFELYAGLPSALRAGLRRVVGMMPGERWVPLVRRARSYIRRASTSMPARLRTYEFLGPDTIADVFGPTLLATVDPDGPVRTMDEIWRRTAAHSGLQRQLHFALHTIVAENDVPKVTRMCAAGGVEVRFPLLDDDVITFAAQIPPNVLVRRGHPRALQRESLRGFLPAAIIAKEKHCFAHPIGAWLAAPTALRSHALRALRALSKRGIVRHEYVAALSSDRHAIATPYHAGLVWSMMVLEEWLAAREAPVAAPRSHVVRRAPTRRGIVLADP